MRIVPKSRGHAVREVVIPTCFFCSKRQNSERSRIMAEQRLAISDGILLRRVRQLVHEAFDHKDVVGWSDAAPESRPNTRGLDPDIVDVDVRQRVGRLGRRFYGIEVVSVLE